MGRVTDKKEKKKKGKNKDETTDIYDLFADVKNNPQDYPESWTSSVPGEVLSPTVFPDTGGVRPENVIPETPSVPDPSAALLASFQDSIANMKAGFAEQMRVLQSGYDSQIAKMKRDQELERHRRQKESTFRAQRSISAEKSAAGVAGGGLGGGGGTVLTGLSGSKLGGQAGKTLLGL